MDKKDRLDTFGIVSLVLFSAFLGFNQVVIKVVNEGLQPTYFAGLRSAGATVCVALWMWARGIRLRPLPGTVPAGLMIGCVFAAEFLFLFTALDLTTVSRSSVVFYSMPLWMALGAHFLIPGQKVTRMKAVGLLLAFAGVAWAILNRPDTGEASLIGDLCALGAAIGWATAALMARASKLRDESPEMQLLWQVAISAPILLLAAPLFGPLIRDLQPIHLWGLAFQIVLVVSAGFVFWLWLLSIYPPASVAAYGFLGPIFGVGFGWLLLGEEVGPTILGALALVAVGLYLINRPPKAARA
ncbi:MAG: DMT family transporter [Alphaproteobacteria bacterium]|nr:DMT family transporter [Alphaproteobacteria bacterium]NNF70617.1 DMT family transporter [Paracoccaceae bacterium]